MRGLLRERRVRSTKARIPSAFALLALGACGGGAGGEGGGAPATYAVYIQSTDPVVASGHIDLFGSATCDACPPAETAFGGCPVIQGPFDSSIEILWHNVTTGESGNASHFISGQCGCLFSYCTVTYAHRFHASVPLAIGPNEVEILALGPQFEPGSSTVAITRMPSAPANLVAVPEHNAITLTWDPVPEASSYELLWSLTPDLDAPATRRITGVASPFRHAGLPDDATFHYAVAAVISGFTGPHSDVVWATTGWTTEDMHAVQANWAAEAIGIAIDGLDRAHVHLSRREDLFPTWRQHDEYLTNATGAWSSTSIANVQWPDGSVAVDAQDSVHVGYIGAGGLTHATITAGVWSSEVLTTGGWCRSSFALDALDRLHAAYRTSEELRAGTNAGGAWSSRPVETMAFGCGSSDLAPVIAVDASGAEHVAYEGVWPGYGLQYAVDVGVAWERATIAPGTLRSFAFALDLQGAPNFVYSDAAAAVWHVQPDAIGGWTSALVDVEPGSWPALTVDAEGHAHVSYVSGSNGGELRLATNTNGAWNVARISPAVIAPTAIALDSQGRVHVAYFSAQGPRYATNR